jgi:hypothetical protein
MSHNKQKALPDPQILEIGGGPLLEQKMREFALKHGLQIQDVQDFLDEISKAKKLETKDSARARATH